MSYLSDDFVRSSILAAMNIPLVTIPSTGGTTTISASTLRLQVTGTLNHTIRMYDATTVPQGRSLYVWNESLNTVTFVNQSNTILFFLEPQCVANIYLLDNTTPDGYWKDSIVFPIEDSMLEMKEDWLSSNTTGQNGWTISNSGGGSSVAIGTSLANHWGIIVMNCGTSNNGDAATHAGIINCLYGAGTSILEANFFLETQPSATENSKIWVGTGDVLTEAEMVDGVYLRIDRAVSTTNWVLGTSNNSVRTNVVTGTAFTAGWHTVRIEVNYLGTAVFYYLDELLLGSVTTNIPTGTGRVFGPLFKIANASATLTASRLWVDYCHVRAYLNR